MHTNKKSVQHICKILDQKGIENVVISPGSRNAPFSIELSNNENMNITSVVDERCAGFFALGISIQTRKPTAIICTSGSALINYYPAVIEAFYQDVPLIVISADRPKEWINQNDGQTIRQENIFENHIHKSVNLKLGEDSQTLWYNDRLVNEAVNISLQNKVVHINVPLEEPLYETIEKTETTPKIINFYKGIKTISKEEIQLFVDKWNKAQKKIILIGQINYTDEYLNTQLKAFFNDPSVLIFTEKTSNLFGENYISSIDKIINVLDEKSQNNLRPEILLTLGGQVVSKKIKAFFRTYRPELHWHVSKEDMCLDTYQSLTDFVQIPPTEFLKEFLPQKINSNFRNKHLNFRKKINQKHNEYLEIATFSDLKVYDMILKKIPKNSVLHSSNSATIRYIQLFDLNENVQVYCNRGTSGIEGSSSTAVGYAYTSNKQVTLITGDISFLYDSNALWNTCIPNNFRIVIVNNSGGGIFRIIAQADENILEKFLETKHELSAKHLAKMYDFDYVFATDKNGLRDQLKSFYDNSEQPKILEIFTPQKGNDKVLKKYWEYLSS